MNFTAGKSFTYIVIGIAFQGKRDPFRYESTKALTCRTNEMETESYREANLRRRNDESLHCPQSFRQHG